MKAKRFWTQEEINILVDLYPDHETKKIAEQLGRSVKSIFGKVDELKIKKYVGFLNKKTGIRPSNYLHEGTTQIDERGYVRIKTKFNTWELKHRFIWEKEHNQKIPDGHSIRFKDGNRNNFEINNLELISKKEVMKLNAIHNYPVEIIKTIRLLSALNRKINERHK
tara:strand:- start:7231 stop:7728 length:498 start_codon:yes stop_codon:yes gene_type:complete